VQYPEGFFAVRLDGVSIALRLGVITIVILSDRRGVYDGGSELAYCNSRLSVVSQFDSYRITPGDSFFCGRSFFERDF
jgi:hypothetical protein